MTSYFQMKISIFIRMAKRIFRFFLEAGRLADSGSPLGIAAAWAMAVTIAIEPLDEVQRDELD